MVDSPYLSAAPKQLCEVIANSKFDHVIFADVCKQGAGMIKHSHLLAYNNKSFLVCILYVKVCHFAV